MTVITGVVEAISEKEGQYGPMISFKINGDWMMLKGAKFKPRDIKEGDTVEADFSVNPRGYKDIVKGGLRLASAGGGQSAAPAQPAANAKPYKDPRQAIISTQSALNTAIAFVNVAITAEAMPSITGKANDKLAFFRTWVLDEAARFYKLSTGEELDVSGASEVLDAAIPVKRKAPAKKASEDDYPDQDEGTDEYEDG